MKRISVLLLVLSLLLVSCGDSKNLCINGKSQDVQVYGWIDAKESIPSVRYKIVIGNVVWSVILSESIAVPILITGLALWEPVGCKDTTVCNTVCE